MLKNILSLAVSGFFLISCDTHQEKKDLVWYNGQVIEQLEPQGDSVYRIQIGIMASSFWLEQQHQELEDYIFLLRNSLTQRDSLNIGVEKGSNKILIVEKAK